MPARTFYTRSPLLADLKRLVQENTRGEYRFETFKRLFEAVDAHFADQYPPVDHGGWFNPRILGGAQVNHIPPHVVFAVYAIFMHLAHGDMDPVPFMANPLELNGATAVTLEPTDRFLVVDREGEAFPMTDCIIIAPTPIPVTWTQDTYGLPELQPDVMVIGWHAAAQPHVSALATAQTLCHRPSRKALNPLATFTEADEQLYFKEPVNPARLGRHRERLAEVFGTPLDVLRRNSETAQRMLEACLAS